MGNKAKRRKLTKFWIGCALADVKLRRQLDRRTAPSVEPAVATAHNENIEIPATRKSPLPYMTRSDDWIAIGEKIGLSAPAVADITRRLAAGERPAPMRFATIVEAIKAPTNDASLGDEEVRELLKSFTTEQITAGRRIGLSAEAMAKIAVQMASGGAAARKSGLTKKELAGWEEMIRSARASA